MVTKNAQGVYDTVAIYKSKKGAEPIVVLNKTQVVVNDIMDTVSKKGNKVDVVRQAILIGIAPDGSNVELWWGNAMEAANDLLFHPKTILADLRANVGELRSVSMMIGNSVKAANEIFAPLWESYLAGKLHELFD